MAKILVVDDDEGVMHMLKTLLEFEGFFVVSACNGEHAWSVLIDNPDFDLMICDVVMPELDGRALVARIRQQPDHFRFPIIMISGFVPFKDIRGILELGVDQFIPKPFHADDILESVRSCLS